MLPRQDDIGEAAATALVKANEPVNTAEPRSADSDA
jgi:hypothetical protein